MFYTLDSIKPERSDWEEYLQEQSEEYRKFIEPGINDPDREWDKYWSDPNPKVLKEDLYQGAAKRPAYILRGKKVTPEQAFEIIAAESAPVDFFGDMYQKHKKPEKERIFSNHDVKLYREQEFDWIRSWIDPDGNIGESSWTDKFPWCCEFLVDNLEYAARYPYLEYVIIYSELNEVDWDVWEHHDGCIAPFCVTTIEQVMKNFSYAVWVHDGGAEVVREKRARELYDAYNACYEDEKIFARNDWDRYVHHFIDEEYLKRLNEVWHLKKEKFDGLMKILRERKSVEEEWKHYKEVFCDRQNDSKKDLYVLRTKLIDAIADAVRKGTFSELDLAPYWKKFMEIPLDNIFEED